MKLETQEEYVAAVKRCRFLFKKERLTAEEMQEILDLYMAVEAYEDLNSDDSTGAY